MTGLRRRCPVLSRLAFGILFTLLALPFPGCRDQEPTSPSPGPPPVPEVTRAARTGRPVIFVGLDGADWELLDPYMAAGKMPKLARLVREGRSGVLTTIHPPLSPLVWTTMMTGVSPLEHGVLDFVRRNPASGAEEPVTSDERRVPAIWNMATWAGRSVAVFGLWATYPAEPVRGLLVADRFSSFTSVDRDPPPGIVYPQSEEPPAREALAAAEREVDFAALQSYLPWLGGAEYRAQVALPDPYAHPVSALRRILVETRAYDELARSWIAREKPDLAVVYFQGTDTVGHVFAPFAPPRQPAVSEEDFARFQRVPELYFAEIDRLLGRYRQLAEARGAVLMLASDHGFHWKEGRPAELSSAAAPTAGLWHRDEGIYLLWGPGITKGERDRGAVAQVCSTLLALLGLPPGRGLADPPVPGAPAATGNALDYKTWYQRPQAMATASGGTEEIEKLRSLGYLGKSGEKPRDGSTRTAASYDNEGLLLRQAGKDAEAARAFEQALALNPQSAATMWNLSELLLARGDSDRDRADALLVQALTAGLPQGSERTVARAIAYARGGEPERSLRLLASALEAHPDDGRLYLFHGRYLFDAGRCREALADFDDAIRLSPDEALAHTSRGLAHLCLGDPQAAAKDFQRSLAIDPNQPQVREALAQMGPG